MDSGFTISYEREFILRDIPKPWITKFELYYPDLPGYPIIYVHLVHNGRRIYGFPATVSFDMHENTCSVRLAFLSNVDLNSDRDAADVVEKELLERFGMSGKIGKENIDVMCRGDGKYGKFFHELWKYVSEVSGEFVPYGRFYEETLSIVRFVSAFQPKTGRQSEMRMMYNFMSMFGERVQMPENWKFLHFFVIPTYGEILRSDLSKFPRFEKIHSAMRKIWETEFPKKISLKGMTVRSMKRGWPHTRDQFVTEILGGMQDKGIITLRDKFLLGRLVDAFNRCPRRTAFFIWSIMSITGNDYVKWDKDMFVEFYTKTSKSRNTKTSKSRNTKTSKSRNTKTTGVSQKVVACFLQQGFGKKEMIPIDTWIESFHTHALGIENQQQFFDSFDNMGEMERLIWVAAQSKKTNMAEFQDILWCIRYGDRRNHEIRGANPISCYECKLRTACPGYAKIEQDKILVREESKGDVREQRSRKGNFTGQILNNREIEKSADTNGCRFVCLTMNEVPKKILFKKRKTWKLIDEFSGYALSSDNDKLSKHPETMTTDEFVNNLGVFRRHVDTIEITD